MALDATLIVLDLVTLGYTPIDYFFELTIHDNISDIDTYVTSLLLLYWCIGLTSTYTPYENIIIFILDYAQSVHISNKRMFSYIFIPEMFLLNILVMNIYFT